jgi:hypothetical protein
MPYRDDLAALRSREEALARELAGRQQELDEIRKTIDGLRPRFRLRVASPCPADWNAMQGDDRVRFCGQCEKNVYNISAMTHAEAEDLIREKEGKLCVRFYQRTDGTVLTADCPVGRRRRRKRHIVMLAGTAGLALVAAAGFVSFARMGKPEYPLMYGGALSAPPAPSFPTHTRAVMGDAVMGDPIAPPAPRPIRPDDTLPLHYRAIPQVPKP